ncbi:hypothetical protein BSL82_09385 [Tardibacter chloracetimidivorans]|uniref:DUF1643 domain-containing protein n=1 Tax=Tardibacter chloracetimidivorans TaxID=1921510 RepID=A0A1L3ZV31_9SPHN|nr:DUF1643 domain-containing protein [Tardibacter chloracetimidivorans]API59492.1 hypothetical protein BSL82_09385 [Tardibacter chloracetimidivorans]
MSAIISPCGKYRYRLERPDVFGDFSTAVIMVNPSTADAERDDATIRKLIGFRNRYGWGNLIVGNLFAYRATDVRELARVSDPAGLPDNDLHLMRMFREAQQIVVAWGPISKQPAYHRGRFRKVLDLIDGGKPVFSIGAPAKDGHPCHPLMLPYSRQLQPWSLHP